MDILYLLIPLSTVLVLAILGVFAWALHTGQFDDLEDEGVRILADERTSFDDGQGALELLSEQSRPAPQSPGREPR